MAACDARLFAPHPVAQVCEIGQQLAADFGLPVEFSRGSFIPRGALASVDAGDGFAWLTTNEVNAHEGLGLDPRDFAVIFAYPWPDEERVTRDLFERYAAVGAVLVTYHGGQDFLVRRKSGKCSRGRCGQRRSRTPSNGMGRAMTKAEIGPGVHSSAGQAGAGAAPKERKEPGTAEDVTVYRGEGVASP